MPIMDFLENYDENDTVQTSFKLAALMHYPHDWQKREEFYAINNTQHTQKMSRMILGRPVAKITEDENINILLSRLSDTHGDLPNQSKLAHMGILSGLRLMHVIALDAIANKGSFVNADELLPYLDIKDGANKKVSTAKGSIHRAWKIMMPVAHIWAAYNLSQQFTNIDEPTHEARTLIGLAEWFRHFGENFCPKTTSRPLLDPEQTWRPPENFQFKAYEEMPFLPFHLVTPNMLSKL